MLTSEGRAGDKAIYVSIHQVAFKRNFVSKGCTSVTLGQSGQITEKLIESEFRPFYILY